MSETGIIQMIIDKLDKIEDKVEKINDKLTDFEVKASEILAVHDCDIIALKLKVDRLNNELKENDIKINEITKESNSSNILKTILDSAYFNYVFRFVVLLLLTIIAGSDKIKLISGILK